MRRTIQIMTFVCFLILFCLALSISVLQGNKEALSGTKEETNIMMNETMPIEDSCSQEIPIIFSVDTDGSAGNSAQRLFSEEDFASLVEGKSTLDDLLPIIGDYPVWAISYGFLYEIDLIEGNHLNIVVDPTGVIIDIYYS